MKLSNTLLDLDPMRAESEGLGPTQSQHLAQQKDLIKLSTET